jgi:hypothetical protein
MSINPTALELVKLVHRYRNDDDMTGDDLRTTFLAIVARAPASELCELVEALVED